jgi:hypothetical protein
MWNEAVADFHKLKEGADNLADFFEETIESLCVLCKKINPHHKNCISCPEKDIFFKSIKKYRTIAG